MSYAQRDIELSARALVRRYGIGALRRAETQAHRMERLCAYEAATTWSQLAQAIRTILAGHNDTKVRRTLIEGADRKLRTRQGKSG